MRLKNLFSIPLFVFSIGLSALAPSWAYSQEACEITFGPTETEVSRSELVEKIREEKLPAVLARTNGKAIPVILMNGKTGPILAEFLENSIGTQVAHQPNWNNDHGLFRLAKVIADMDSPGARTRGEIHQTGISWVELSGYLSRESGYKRIEVAYALTKSELRTAQLYGRMRRAAIIRVRFSFGNAHQDTNLPNFLNGGGENCFGFCQSSAIDSQISEMKTRFKQLSLGDIEEVVARSDVNEWLEVIREELLQASISDSLTMSPRLPSRKKIPESLASAQAFKDLSEEKRSEALNWLVGFDVSVPYRDLIRTLGFQNSGNGFNGMNNMRASAVLIYDSSVSPENFIMKEYESRGIFSSWSNQNTSPIE